MKHCPICGSSRVVTTKDTFYCKNCGYLNKPLIRKSVIKQNKEKL